MTEGCRARTSFDSPECPILLVVSGAETSDALWECDLEGGLKLAELSVFLVVGLAPEDGSIVDEEA